MDRRLTDAETIVFDIGNVLLHFDSKEICRCLLPEDIRPALQEAMFGEHAIWPQFDCGLESNEAIARRIAQAAKLPEAWQQVLYVLCHFHEVMHPLPLSSLIPVLKAQGKRLYALTNFPEPSFSFTLAAFPFLQQMDGYVVSAREKLTKPSREIFELLAARYQIRPENTLFIDDVRENVEGAQKMGFRIWHYCGEDRIFS